MTGVVTRVSLALIRRDGGTQMRTSISMEVAKDYAEAMSRGDKFPPPRVRYDGTHYWLADGFHRCMAAELRQDVAIDVEVTPGTRREAILDAIGANATHGYRRTNADKRHEVETLLADEEWSRKSDREIARKAQVDVGMVGRARPKPSVGERQTRTVTRGGKTFEMDVEAINKARAPEKPLAPEDPSTAPPLRGSRQLRVLLGELRRGADVAAAADVAEMSLGEAALHAEAERGGEYADIDPTPPLRSFEGDQLTIRTAPSEEVSDEIGQLPPSPGAAANDEEPHDPQPYDFDEVSRRESVMDAIATLATAPAPDEMAAIWARHIGRPRPPEIVVLAAQWMSAFAHLFPQADLERERAVGAMLEKL